MLKSTFNYLRVLAVQFSLRFNANCLPLSKAVVGQSGLGFIVDYTSLRSVKS